jgi:biopolymer transport protein ExbB
MKTEDAANAQATPANVEAPASEAAPVANETPAQTASEAPATPTVPPASGAVADKEANKDNASQEESMLTWLVNASGVFGGMIFLCSFCMVALIVLNIMQVTRANFIPTEFLVEFEQKINGRDFQGAYEQAKNDNSLIARVMAAGLGNLNRGLSEANQSMEDVGVEENMDFEHRLAWLSTIAAVSPMLGLLGTVQGMIIAFSEIAGADVAPKPKDLAYGISVALVTTLEGLVVAIPCMIAFVFFKNRVARFMLEVGIVSERLINRIAAASKAKSANPGT